MAKYLGNKCTIITVPSSHLIKVRTLETLLIHSCFSFNVYHSMDFYLHALFALIITFQQVPRHMSLGLVTGRAELSSVKIDTTQSEHKEENYGSDNISSPENQNVIAGILLLLRNLQSEFGTYLFLLFYAGSAWSLGMKCYYYSKHTNKVWWNSLVSFLR